MEKEKPTSLLYLVPIFMGLLGGILMYIAVKDQNQQMANDGIALGSISTVILIVIFFAISYLGLVGLPILM